MEFLRNIAPFLLVGVMFFLMMKGGGCCGGHSGHSEKDPNEKNQIEDKNASRKSCH
ncbi:MAG: hypothetical protein GX434_14265 [Peptococcaceae bacterium]|nr:hypothetical protein [Peptococcaceae bacterium]